jgi:hypothetical protein
MDLNKIKGAWGEGIDSKKFVDDIRKGRPVSTRKFYKTVYTLEILSEEPLEGFLPSLMQLHYMITDGDCSGKMVSGDSVEIDGATAAKLLIEQGSDPEFFMLDEYGNDISDEDTLENHGENYDEKE